MTKTERLQAVVSTWDEMSDEDRYRVRVVSAGLATALDSLWEVHGIPARRELPTDVPNVVRALRDGDEAKPAR